MHLLRKNFFLDFRSSSPSPSWRENQLQRFAPNRLIIILISTPNDTIAVSTTNLNAKYTWCHKWGKEFDGCLLRIKVIFFEIPSLMPTKLSIFSSPLIVRSYDENSPPPSRSYVISARPLHSDTFLSVLYPLNNCFNRWMFLFCCCLWYSHRLICYIFWWELWRYDKDQR